MGEDNDGDAVVFEHPVDLPEGWVSPSSKRFLAASMLPALLASATSSSDLGVKGVAKSSG